jgi:hypothetical protein
MASSKKLTYTDATMLGHVGTMFLVEITTIPFVFPFVLIAS